MARAVRSTFGLAAIVSLIFAVATLAIGAVVYEVTHEALEEQLDHRIALETQALLAEQALGGRERLRSAIDRREAARDIASLGYLLTDARGARLAGTLATEPPARPGYSEFLEHGPAGARRHAQALTTTLPGGGTLIVAADRTSVDAIDATIFKLFAAALGAMLVLGIASAWAVGTITRARLNRIDRAARAINAGDLAQRMPVDGSGSEFDRLAATLNGMLDRIGALIDNLRRVSGDIAHDLRTPLTRLQNRLGDALSLADRGAQRAAIEAAAGQAGELLEIFAAMLRISEIEALRVRDGFRRLDLSALVAGMLETYAPDAEAGGHRLDAAIAPEVTLDGDPRLLKQLIANLLDNALRHTPPGTAITVSLQREGNAAVLMVTDDGPGVGAGEAGRLFQRFSRSERSRSTEGHGLGLALVAAIAGAHFGSASIAPGGPGFTVRIVLGSAAA